METPTDTFSTGPFAEETSARTFDLEELKRRVTAGLALATLFLLTLIAGSWWFAILVLIAALLMIREWDFLTLDLAPMWKHLGLAYVGLPCASLLWLRSVQLANSPNAGLSLIIYVTFVVWATDIGAYFAGRYFGGPKLAPLISPKKTWAGALGGLLAAAGIGAICDTFSPYPVTFVGAIFTAILLSVTAQAGDLFESWLKRTADVKDSGTLIPGHGGILDRVDGLVFSAPLFALLVALSGRVL